MASLFSNVQRHRFRGFPRGSLLGAFAYFAQRIMFERLPHLCRFKAPGLRREANPGNRTRNNFQDAAALLSGLPAHHITSPEQSRRKAIWRGRPGAATPRWSATRWPRPGRFPGASQPDNQSSRRQLQSASESKLQYLVRGGRQCKWASASARFGQPEGQPLPAPSSDSVNHVVQRGAASRRNANGRARQREAQQPSELPTAT